MSGSIGKSRFVLLAWVLLVFAFGLPRAGQASILEEMVGELRLQAPAECLNLFDSLDPAPFGRFHLDPGDSGAGQPGTVSLNVPGGMLTAKWVRGNGAREVDPSTGRPVEPTPINANAFDAICALTKGFTTLDPNACGQNIWNSQNIVAVENPTGLEPRIMIALTNLLSGQCRGLGSDSTIGGCALVDVLGNFTDTTRSALSSFPYLLRTTGNFGGPLPTPLVPLARDGNDGDPLVPPSMEPGFAFWPFTALQPVLTDEQEALLGCGPFYGTQCDLDGIGLIGSELSALLQSWPRSEGEPVCTRYQGSMTSILPGCGGPGDPGYDPDQDGTTDGLDVYDGTSLMYADGTTLAQDPMRRHPFTGQYFASEMAVLSWNYLEGLVALSFAENPGNVLVSEFDPDDPLRLDGCSLANPLPCCNVAGALSVTTRAPEEDPSQPPLRRYLWETGAEYLVTEATGDLGDFLGWTLFAYGPEQSRVSGVEVGIPFFLSPPDPPPPIPDSPLIVRHPGADGILGTEDDNFAGVAYGVVQPLRMVEIDIKPGNRSNPINPKSKGVIPVAILTTEDFDALTVDADSVRFGPDEAEKRNKRAQVKDADHDGDLDLVLQFRTQETGIAPGDTEACLIGQTYDGVPIMGCESLRTVPPK